ncbi:DUF1223 domain-containing protein [Sphingomonas sp. LB-2]|nr:DUF1223 domain-containing protein [Sphingomonas caeni]
MIRSTILSLFALAACSGSAPASAPADPAGPAHPVAVELFTSQGCSSCPPADALMEKLAAGPDVVAITRPVTYWDELGWKDTLARPANTELQHAYAARKIPGAGVYTPQTVVQGRTGFVGSSEGKIRGEIVRQSHAAEPGLAISGGAVRLSGSGRGQLWVAAVRKTVTVRIGSGENGGRKIRYANVLVGETRIGEWKGGSAEIAVPTAAMRVAGADRYVLLLRDGPAGPILAARYL